MYDRCNFLVKINLRKIDFIKPFSKFLPYRASIRFGQNARKQNFNDIAHYPRNHHFIDLFPLIHQINPKFLISDQFVNKTNIIFSQKSKSHSSAPQSIIFYAREHSRRSSHTELELDLNRMSLSKPLLTSLSTKSPLHCSFPTDSPNQPQISHE